VDKESGESLVFCPAKERGSQRPRDWLRGVWLQVLPREVPMGKGDPGASIPRSVGQVTAWMLV
jgi:hypothetical protein